MKNMERLGMSTHLVALGQATDEAGSGLQGRFAEISKEVFLINHH